MSNSNAENNARDDGFYIDETKMCDRTAFFYGTLMAKEVLYRVIFGTSTISKHEVQVITPHAAILHDHLRSRVKNADYPAVIPSEGHSVRGTYVTGLTDGDIYRLDMFEGSAYSLQKVRVRLLDVEGDAATGKGNVEGEEVDTYTYIWTASREHLEDGEWDYADFRKKKLQNWADDSVEFEDVDNAVAEMDENVDPTGGRGRNGHITQALADEHAKAKQEKGDEGEPLKSAV